MSLFEKKDFGKINDYLEELKKLKLQLEKELELKKKQLKNFKDFLEAFRALERNLHNSKTKLYETIDSQVQIRLYKNFDKYKEIVELEIESLSLQNKSKTQTSTQQNPQGTESQTQSSQNTNQSTNQGANQSTNQNTNQGTQAESKQNTNKKS
jgi:hypothetical protein